MTKQEFENAVQKLKDSYVCDSDYYPRLVDLDSEYIASLEAENEGLRTRIAELEKQFDCAYETLAELIVCPHEVYGWKHPEHNCNECDNVNGETCFCWKLWIENKTTEPPREEG